MERLYKEYGEQVEFLIVYIREAHPEMLKEGNQTGVVGRPGSTDERVILATACATKYKFTIPMVIDYIDGKVAETYAARTVRTTITDLDGKVAYYAARGPWGFKISEIEKALGKLVANGGYLPPPPEPSWGEAVDGLSLGIAVEPERLELGHEISVRFEFKNETRDPLLLAFDPEKARGNLRFENELGQALMMGAVAPANRSSRGGGQEGGRRRTRRARPQTLEPGTTYATSLDGELMLTPETVTATPGQFHVNVDFSVDEGTLEGFWSSSRSAPAWMGELRSGSDSFDLALARPMSCSVCHGNENGHHLDEENDCSLCHVDIEGENAAYDLVMASCSRCHLRGDERGRRQILGKDGEFAMASVHFPGEVDREVCHVCHDPNRHGEGAVHLLDPSTGGKAPWTGSHTDFCLSCHNADPPDGVCFPEPNGSGYDKTSYAESTVGRLGLGCDSCHLSHGSPHGPLLKDAELQSPH